MVRHLLQATATGEQHGLINTLTNSVPFDDFKNMKPEEKTQLIKEKKEDSRMVKVEYINRIGKHERLSKPYCKYAGDPIQMWHLIPGRIYELPMGFIKEVNEKKTMVRSGLLEVDGEKINKDGTPLERDSEADWIHKLIPSF